MELRPHTRFRRIGPELVAGSRAIWKVRQKLAGGLDNRFRLGDDGGGLFVALDCAEIAVSAGVALLQYLLAERLHLDSAAKARSVGLHKSRGHTA